MHGNEKTQMNKRQNINISGTNYVEPECDTQEDIRGSINLQFPCPICQRSFKYKDELRRHSKHSVHKNVQSFKCRLCGKRNRFLKNHIAMCPVLSKNDTNVRTIMPQKRPRMFPCPICACTFKFRYMYNLRKHIFSTAHNNIEASTCKFCGKNCERKMDLLHVRKCFGPRENNSFQYKLCPGKEAFGLTCPICLRAFGNKRNLKRHIKNIHGNIRRFTCKICLKRGENVKDFLFHMESCTHALQCNSYDRIIEDNTVSQPFSCPICERSFTRSDNLRRHVKINHKDLGKFICRLCFKSGNTVDGFEQHVSLCSRRIQSKDSKENISPKKHRAEENKSRLFPCPICKCAFRFRYNLRTHVHGPIHKNTGHFTCKFCSQSGSGILDIESHLKCYDHHTKHGLRLSVKGKAPRIKKTNGQKNTTNKNCEKTINLLEKYYAPPGNQPKYTSYQDNKSVILTCPLCSREFGTKRNLKRHIKNIHGNIRRFTCKICLKRGENVKDFLFHMESCTHALQCNSYDRIIEDNTVTPPFSCPICERSFTRTDNLRRHVKMNHKDLGTFVCRLCFKSGNTVDDFEQHFSCCSQRVQSKDGKQNFSSKKNCAVKKSIRLFPCPICNCVFRFRYNLRAHVHGPVHKNTGHFTCKFCSQSGSGTLDIVSHLKSCDLLSKHGHRHHVSEKSHRIKKTNGQKNTTNKNCEEKIDLLKKYSVPTGNPPKYTTYMGNKSVIRTCPICAREFGTKCSLIRHIKDIHGNIRRFSCKICLKRGENVNDFLFHMKRCLHALRRNSYDRMIEDNTVTNPFSCPICERSFTRSDSLRRHVKINHKDLGKFICRLCFKSGNTVDELEQHVSRCSQRIHRNFSSLRSTPAKKNSSINRQMKYACFICDDLYPDRTKLVRHFRAHHGSLKTFTCNFCFHSGQNDPSSQALIEHLNLCHGYPRLEYKCHICHCIFTAKHKLNAHLKIKHHQSEDVSANRKLCCFLCDGFFPDANGLFQHLQDAHKDIRTLACKFCSYAGSIDNIQDFIKHVLRCEELTVPDTTGKSHSTTKPSRSLTTDKPKDRVSRTLTHHYWQPFKPRS